MATSMEDLKVLQVAETVADEIWREVLQWESFARDIVGGQLVRATDSIGANIAEAFGRFHYGEKLQFLYYARGSLFETKYWLNRAQTRDLVDASLAEGYGSQLTALARQLNAFARSIKGQQKRKSGPSNHMKETTAEYTPDLLVDPLLSEEELARLATLQSPISNLQ
jgi:four helix bundle protein